MLGLAIGGFTYFIQLSEYYFTCIALLILITILAIELIHFIEKGYRQLNSMLQSVKEKDFNTSFNEAASGEIFTDLARLLNELTTSYRETRIEKEAHYQFLNHIVDQVAQAMVCFDEQGKVLLSNLASRKMLGQLKIEHITDFSYLDTTLPEQLTELGSGQQKVISFTHQGELLRYSVTCSSIRLLNKQSKLIVMYDISQPLREQEIESYRKLVRVLTHEIMNSVTPILSLSETMNETLLLPDNSPRPLSDLTPQESLDIADGYKAIEIRSRSLMRFVNDFRSLTKLPKPNLISIDIEKLAEPIITLLKPILNAKGINFCMIIGKSARTVYADKDLLEQVVINLIKNSIDALEGAKQPEICIETKATGNNMVVAISDNGSGISPDNIENIFVPFFSTKAQGSGIGLSLSQQIMKLHNGSISFKSNKGNGTTFFLNFPNPNS